MKASSTTNKLLKGGCLNVGFKEVLLYNYKKNINEK
jgi:hypothetical protein